MKNMKNLALATMIATTMVIPAIPAAATMKQQANVPNAQFAFTVSPGEAKAATADTPEVYVGVGTPTVTIAAFAPGQTTWTSAQGADTVEIPTGYKYAKQTATVNFTGVNYTKPGIYRYVVTETSPTYPGITVTDGTQRIMDVYVNSDDAGILSVAGVVIHDSADQVCKKEEIQTIYKDGGFTNNFQTSDLELEKIVTGNQGDRTKYFAFTVNFNTSLGKDMIYDVVLTDAEGTTSLGQNSARLVSNNSGGVSATYYLKANQKIKIQGLDPDVTYTITETDYSAEGYETSNILSSGGNAGAKTKALSCGTTIGADDDSVQFENHRQGTVPTSALLRIAPYAALAALGAAMLAFVNGFKKKFAR